MGAPYNLKIRLMQLGKNQKQLVEELNRRNVKISYLVFSAYINKTKSSANGDSILEQADKIVTEWEQEKTA